MGTRPSNPVLEVSSSTSPAVLSAPITGQAETSSIARADQESSARLNPEDLVYLGPLKKAIGILEDHKDKKRVTNALNQDDECDYSEFQEMQEALKKVIRLHPDSKAATQLEKKSLNKVGNSKKLRKTLSDHLESTKAE